MDQNLTAPPAETTPPPAPQRWPIGIDVIAILVFVLAFFLGSFRAANSDLWLNLAAGKLLATGQYEFGKDPFSWASDGAYWANPSWLSSLGAYLIYDNFGGVVLVVVKALIVVALAGFLFAARFRDSPLLPALELTALAVLVASPRFLMQPAVLSFACLAALVWLLTRDGYFGGQDAAAKAKPLWQIPLLFLVWSNLDGFFVLGLAALAFVAAGLAVFADARSDAKRLAILLGASVVACVLNPHLFANFTLPTDLAFMLQGILPESMTVAGHAVDPFVRAGESAYAMYSPFTSRGVVEINFTVAGIAFYLLVVVNVVSFVVCGFVPGDKAYFARLITCLAFGILAALQYRLAPFYAIVAAPLAVQNFTEYVRWSRHGKPYAPGGVRFAAVVTALLLFVAVLLAWPGWLHLGLTQFHDDAMFQAVRRVDWECQPDPSMHNAALTLGAEAAAGRIHNVFNLTPEIAHYCAYFAPEAKCGVDGRMSLFAAKAKAYADLRTELWEDFLQLRSAKKDEPKKDEPKKEEQTTSWPQTMAKWNVDVVAIASSGRQPPKSLLLAELMLRSPAQWKPIVADGQSLAAVYSGIDKSWPENYLLAKWRREAFAPRPETEWLPGNREVLPRVPTWSDDYLWGRGLKPLETSIASFDWKSHQNYSRLWLEPYFDARQRMETLVLGNLGAAPGAALGLQAVGSIGLGELLFRRRRANEHSWFHSLDFGPASLPILAKRELRRSLLENPLVPETYELLAQVTRQTQTQELWWTRSHLTPFRDDLRKVELVTALRNAVNLAPDNFHYREQLRDALYGMNYFDAGLVEYGEAIRILDESPSSPASLQKYYPYEFEMVRQREMRGDRGADRPNEPRKNPYVDQFEKIRGKLKDDHKRLAAEMKKRLDDLDLKTTNEWERFLVAGILPWRYTDLNNKVHEEPTRGLVLEAVRTLEKANVSNWTADQKRDRSLFLIRAYCFQGKIKEAFENFEANRAELGPIGVQCSAWLFAATGWYDPLDQALAGQEKFVEQSRQYEIDKLRDEVVRGLRTDQLIDIPLLIYVVETYRSQLRLMNQSGQIMVLSSQIAELQTLRGLYALERGATGPALAFFEKALTTDAPFADRAMAMRYRDLLRQEGNK